MRLALPILVSLAACSSESEPSFGKGFGEASPDVDVSDWDPGPLWDTMTSSATGYGEVEAIGTYVGFQWEDTAGSWESMDVELTSSTALDEAWALVVDLDDDSLGEVLAAVELTASSETEWAGSFELDEVSEVMDGDYQAYAVAFVKLFDEGLVHVSFDGSASLLDDFELRCGYARGPGTTVSVDAYEAGLADDVELIAFDLLDATVSAPQALSTDGVPMEERDGALGWTLSTTSTSLGGGDFNELAYVVRGSIDGVVEGTCGLTISQGS